jgi:hypothetical protein
VNETPPTAEKGDQAFAAAGAQKLAGPWARCWAKLIDLWLAAGLLFALWKLAVTALQTDRTLGPLAALLADDRGDVLFWGRTFALMAASFVLDALVQWAFGVTPGLALAGARLEALDRRRLSLGQALGRNFEVWLRGFWICIAWYPMILAYVRLVDGRGVPWDTRWRTQVIDRGGSYPRSLLAGLAWLCLIGAYLWLMKRLGL